VIDDLLQEIDGAFAENTLKAYRSDFADFTAWCDAEGLEPWGSTATDWARYIGDREPFLSAATLRRRIHSLNSLFRLANQKPHGDSPAVRLALKRMHRRKGRRQKQATPLTRSILKALLAQCDDGLRGRRNRVLLMLGYETMRRRAELVSFRFDHFERLPGDRFALLLPRSKTDQLGEGSLIGLSPVLGHTLLAWHQQVGDGYILRALRNQKMLPTPLGAGSVSRILKQLQREAGLSNIGELSGHSFRVGRALDLLEQGESLEKIMLRGGWQNDASAIRYLRAWLPQASAVEDLYDSL
jgi:integrase